MRTRPRSRDVLVDRKATLLELGLDPKRIVALLGITAVLHTWTCELKLHPHLHCIVTAGGWSLTEARWTSGRDWYLLPVRVLGALFRGKFLAALLVAEQSGQLRLPGYAGGADPRAFERLTAALYKKSWVVYAKRPFGGAEQVVRYLGRYTHRVGLSNQPKGGAIAPPRSVQLAIEVLTLTA